MSDDNIQLDSLKQPDLGERKQYDHSPTLCSAIYWYPSFRCNLACAHCAVNASPDVDTAHELDHHQIYRVIQQLAELKVRTAIISGGEPLIHSDILYIISALSKHNIRVAIETNGLRFDDGFVSLCRKLQEHDMIQIVISIDGGTPESHERLRGRGTFARTIRNLRLLKDNRIRFVIQSVVNRINYTTIPAMFELGRSLSPELERLQFILLNPVGRGEDLYKMLGLQVEHYATILDMIAGEIGNFNAQVILSTPLAVIPPKHLAMAIGHSRIHLNVSCQFPMLGILPNGDITICAVSRDYTELHLGNVLTHQLNEVWNCARIEALRESYQSGDHLTGICGDCVWKNKCKGSCRAWAYVEGSCLSAPHPTCARLDENGSFPDIYRLSIQHGLVRDSSLLHTTQGTLCS